MKNNFRNIKLKNSLGCWRRLWPELTRVFWSSSYRWTRTQAGALQTQDCCCKASRRGVGVPSLCCALLSWLLSHVRLCDPMDCSPPGSSVHGDSPGKNTGVGFHALLQGIYPTQGLSPGLLQYRWILYSWATWEAQCPPCFNANSNNQLVSETSKSSPAKAVLEIHWLGLCMNRNVWHTRIMLHPRQSWKAIIVHCWATITKYHNLGGLNNRNLFSHGSGGCKDKIKVSAGLISSMLSSNCTSEPSCCILIRSFLCVHPWCIFLSKFLLIISTPLTLD